MIEKRRTIDFDSVSIDPLVLSVVRVEAARLAGRYGFNVADRDDIRQELLLDWVVRCRRFDPARSSRRTFVYRIVRHRVATLRESQSAACRDYRLRGNCLHDSQSVGNESISLADSFSADDCAGWLGRSARSCCERNELRIDVETVTATLPSELAAVVGLLGSENAIEAAKQMAMPRATFYRRIGAIRAAFRSAGLDRYLGRSGRAPVRRSYRSMTYQSEQGPK